MRGAPPVQMACGRDARAAAAVGLLSATAAATIVGWSGWQLGGSLAFVLATVVVAALLGGLAGGWRAGRVGERRLVWDGRSWTLDGIPGGVAVMIDTGDWMLLRFRAARTNNWLSLGLRTCGAPAHLARAALHAHAGRVPAGAGSGST
jgi:hypothetical protein